MDEDEREIWYSQSGLSTIYVPNSPGFAQQFKLQLLIAIRDWQANGNSKWHFQLKFYSKNFEKKALLKVIGKVN